MLTAARRTSDGAPTMSVLDVLRAVAVVCVFSQHFGDHVRGELEAWLLRLPPLIAPWIATVLHHAHWGVDLFFVLSGFTLFLGWLRAQRVGKSGPDARTFWRRRAVRILPAFYVALLVTLWFRPELTRAAGIGPALASHALLLQGYFAVGGLVLIGASWSLTTEASFYALMPWLAPRMLPRARHGLLWLLVVIFASWLVRAGLHAFARGPHAFAGMLEASQVRWLVSRLDQFVLGMLAARIWMAVDMQPALRRLAPAAVGASIAMLVVGFRADGILMGTAYGAAPYPLISMATFGIVLGAALSTADVKGPALQLAASVGTASYGIFLTHELVIGCILHRLPAEWPLAVRAAACLAPSVAVGAASWRFIEKPLLNRGASPGTKPPSVRTPHPQSAEATAVTRLG